MNVPGTSVIKQLPPKDLRAEFRLFLSGTTKPSTICPHELVRKGFTLLKSLPASKDVVLEYFGTFYEKSVAKYLKEIENESNADVPGASYDEVDSIVNEIHLSLYNFISTCPFGWRNIIISWALNLLGTISTKYANRGRAPVNGSLSDSLQQWLSCKATRSLIDINNHCLELMEEKESFEPMTCLLDTCVKHSPHFDWVVAHVGCTYAPIVISRVLISGLQEFANNQGSSNTPKIKSVLDILVHLAGCNKNDIDAAFEEMFKWSLDPDLETDDDRGGILEKNAAGPYLLTLASRSSVLLTSLCDVTLEIMKPEVVEKLVPFGKHWIQYCANQQALFNLIIHLIISINDKAEEIFMGLLLPYATYHNSDVSKVAEEILGLLLKELDILSRGNSSRIPFLVSLGKNKQELFELLLSEKEINRSSAVSIFSFMGNQNIKVLPECISHILLHSTKDDILDAVVKLSQNYTSTDVLIPSINKALGSTEKDELKCLWANLIKLSKWEASGTFTSLPLLESLYANLRTIAKLLCEETDIQVAHSMAELISKPILEFNRQPRVPLLRALVDAIISFFYLIVLDSEWIEQVKGMKLVCSMMKKLCMIGGIARAYAVREIIENSIFKKPSILFGAIPPIPSKLIESPESLMEEHNKQGTSSMLAQKHSTVFHAGVIGTGKRKSPPKCPIPIDKVEHNTGLLIQFLNSATECGGAQSTLEAVISIALLLVELISPDVMYNGLPWPEEDFCKVTIERDLAIRRTLNNKPVVWALLTFIAHHRPALCYCSVILRAVLSTLLSEWSSGSQQDNPDVLITTNKLLQLMALGQLLPLPFTALSDIIPNVPADQVPVILRDCVWAYLRDHVPSPALFQRDANGVMWRDLATSRPPKQYTEPLRHIMLDNIGALGALFHTLFVHDEDQEQDHDED